MYALSLSRQWDWNVVPQPSSLRLHRKDSLPSAEPPLQVRGTGSFGLSRSISCCGAGAVARGVPLATGASSGPEATPFREAWRFSWLCFYFWGCKALEKSHRHSKEHYY